MCDVGFSQEIPFTAISLVNVNETKNAFFITTDNSRGNLMKHLKESNIELFPWGTANNCNVTFTMV